MVDITDVVILDIDKSDILSAIQKAKSMSFVDNLRQRGPFVKYDCNIRGFIGEAGMTKWLSKYGIQYTIPEPKPMQTNIDILIHAKTGDYLAEVKTSKRPDAWAEDKNRSTLLSECIQNGDIKILGKEDDLSPSEQAIAQYATNRDMHIQIYFQEATDAGDKILDENEKQYADPIKFLTEASAEEIYDALNCNKYLESTFFVAWIDQITLASKMALRAKTGFVHEKRAYLPCNIRYSGRTPAELCIFLKTGYLKTDIIPQVSRKERIEKEMKRTHVNQSQVLQALKIERFDKIENVPEKDFESVMDRLCKMKTYQKKGGTA